jgi:hypothetical protein
MGNKIPRRSKYDRVRGGEKLANLPRLRGLALKPGTMSGRAAFFDDESSVALAINCARARSAAASSEKRAC